MQTRACCGRRVWAACRAALADLDAGAHVVVLEGETDSGKTRLATEFLDWARGQAAEVLVGRTFEAEGGLPYAPLVAALRPRLERENAPDDLRGDLWLAEVARLLPELRERYPDLPPISEDETVGRGRLFEAVARLAQALVERAPLVLFLDDVQWADAATRDLLRYVVRRWAESGARALALVAVRAEDVGARRELAQWLGHLERDAPTLRLGLKALTPDDVAQLVVSLAGLEGVDQADGQADEAARLGHRLAQETAGYPGALMRTLQALLEEGVLALRPLEGGGWVLDLARASQALEAVAGRTAARAPAGIGGRQDWGEAPDTSAFYGRDGELQCLGRCLLADRCRLVGILGIGGIGKTALAARLAREVAPQFEVVYWRSLRNAPPVEEWLASALRILSVEQAALPNGAEARLALLLEQLRERRCLLVLDNLETLLQPGEREARYREGFAGYGLLLHRLGEALHQSCVLVTSREKPSELGPLEGEHTAVRTLRLSGLGTEESRVILQDKGLVGDEAAWHALVSRYGGNPLALKVVGETIGEVMGGDIAPFLEYARETYGTVFGGIRRLLDGQFDRLSALERALFYWLAVEREPVGLAGLVADLGPGVARGEALEALEALGRRSLLERGEHGVTITLQPVVLEYATDRLVEAVTREIAEGRPELLRSHALLKATAKDYVRRSQERLIAASLLEHLAGACGAMEEVDRRLLDLLDGWRGRPSGEQSYGPGNTVNLPRLLQGHLQSVDLSRLSIRQAYLQEVEAQDARLVGAHLAQAVLAEAFDYSVCVALSADGACLVAGTSNGEVRLWRVVDRAPLLAVQGHTGGVYGLALSADGRLVASGSFDGTVRLWEAASGQPLATLQGHTGLVWGVALSADGRLVASGGEDGTVRLWEAASGRLLATLRGHNGAAFCVALAADGQLAASSGMDGTIRLWRVPDGLPLLSVQAHTGAIWAMGLSADGKRVACGARDGTVGVWDAQSGALVRTLRPDRPYERMDISGLSGVTEAQKVALRALGAVERS